ncbi:uncharacterized protein LOC127717576 isoform X2 [Mytilus californianus]|uniref:uncharacterized protein LOC127717576 isoform X2 n=1 Tax=Mytilus californianus TaxID=6549 RepID=UPI0022469043|nr:uncharacterized protein LOC127717576 isoform X2 [Mytilus californianus]
MFSLPSCYSIMNGIHSTCIIFLNGLLTLCIFRCDSDTINIYLSKQNVTGSQDNITGICNATGLSRNEIVLNDTCNRSPVLAWIGAHASYSPWIEYKGCGIYNSNTVLIQLNFTQKNFSAEPDIFKCFEHCRMRYIKHNYIGFQRYKCLCYFTADIEIVQCENITITECGNNQNFICGDRDNVTVIYEIKNPTMILKNDTGECGIVNISDNQTTFSSIECSKKAAILCFDNGTLTGYPNKTENWGKAVRFCQTQNGLISSVENVINGSLHNVTDGTYWVSVVRGISYTSLQDNNVECKTVNIKDNKTTFGSMACLKKAAVLCSNNGTLTGYPNKTENWGKAVRFCQTQNGLISSVENVINGSLLNVTDGTYWVSVVRGISYTSLQDYNVECKTVNIKDNKTTFGSMACLKKAAVLCSKNGIFTAYPTQRENWTQSVKFCLAQDGLVSSVEIVMNESLLNVTDGTYWVSAFRGISVQDSDNDFCVASFIENGKNMTPIVKSCEVRLPVSCQSGSSDLWNGTSLQSQMLNERILIIIIVSGSIGFVVLVIVVIILICKRRKRTSKTENVKSNFHEKTVKHELYAEVLPEVEYKNDSETINIYDHTDTSQIPSKFDTNLPSEYDSMAGIKQEAEGLYDESATCPSGNTQTKEMDGLYDHC